MTSCTVKIFSVGSQMDIHEYTLEFLGSRDDDRTRGHGTSERGQKESPTVSRSGKPTQKWLHCWYAICSHGSLLNMDPYLDLGERRPLISNRVNVIRADVTREQMYATYSRRWYILLVVFILSCSNAAVSTSEFGSSCGTSLGTAAPTSCDSPSSDHVWNCKNMFYILKIFSRSRNVLVIYFWSF